MTNPSLAELLAAFLLGNHEKAHRAATRLTHQESWGNAIRLSVLWRSLPRLRGRISELHVVVPPGEAKSLASFSAASAVESAMISRGAARAFGALDRAGIDATCFKGLAMIASGRREPSERMLNDADILVRESDLPAATAALREAGFSPAIEMELENWLGLLAERVYPAHDFLDFVDKDGVRIDLHWRFRFAGSGFSVDDILSRSVDGSLAGKRVRTVSREDAIVLSANHLIRDQLAPFSAVKDLIDIEILLRGGEDDTSILEQRARDAGLATPVLTGVRILASFLPGMPIATVNSRLTRNFGARDNIAAGRLADLFSHHLRRGTTNQLIIGMAGATPALARRFLVSRLRMLTDPSYRDHKFAGDNRPRAGQLARTFFRDIATLTPAKFRQYRTLAAETRRQGRSEESPVRTESVRRARMTR